MASDVKNVKLGACTVEFDEVDLGFTKGGVEVNISTTTKEVKVDQFGETALDEYITGREVTVDVPLAEFDLAKLVSVIPGATLVSGGTPVKKKIQINSGVGESLRDLAAVLVLHPKDLPGSDVSEDFTVHLASPKGEFKFAYKVDEERVYMVQFKGYVDITNGLIATIGDVSATGS